MLITSILPSPRKPGRFELVVDGRTFATLSIDAIERLKLATGAGLDDATAAAVQREAALLGTYDRALGMLAVRARSAAELRRLLVRKGEPPEQVDPAIERLLHAGFLDDASFARQFARSKALGAGLSRRRLQQELTRRGVARNVADAAVDHVFVEEGVDEDAAIERVAARKLKTLMRLEPLVQRRRLYAFLARRGYDSDDISRVVRALVGEAS